MVRLHKTPVVEVPRLGRLFARDRKLRLFGVVPIALWAYTAFAVCCTVFNGGFPPDKGWQSVYIATLGALALTCLSAPFIFHRLRTIRRIYATGIKVAGRVTETSSSTSLLCLLACPDRTGWRETDYCLTYEADGVKYHKHAVVVNRRNLVDGQVVDILVDPDKPRRFVFPEVFK
jgi:hypothetical protein